MEKSLKKNVQNITYKVKTKNYGKKVVDKVKKGKKNPYQNWEKGKKRKKQKSSNVQAFGV